MSGRFEYEENDKRYGGMPRAGPVRITRIDGTTETKSPITYAQRRNMAATGTAVRRKGIDAGLRLRIYRRDGFTCVYCGTTTGPFQLDHVRPYSKGGQDREDNLVTACRPCNMAKKNTWNGHGRSTP